MYKNVQITKYSYQSSSEIAIYSCWLRCSLDPRCFAVTYSLEGSPFFLCYFFESQFDYVSEIGFDTYSLIPLTIATTTSTQSTTVKSTIPYTAGKILSIINLERI